MKKFNLPKVLISEDLGFSLLATLIGFGFYNLSIMAQAILKNVLKPNEDSAILAILVGFLMIFSFIIAVILLCAGIVEFFNTTFTRNNCICFISKDRAIFYLQNSFNITKRVIHRSMIQKAVYYHPHTTVWSGSMPTDIYFDGEMKSLNDFVVKI